MKKSGFAKIELLLNNSSAKLTSCTEIIYRLTPYFPFFSTSTLSSRGFIETITNISNEYQELSKKEKNENTKLISSTRICIFKLFKRVIEDSEVASSWFSNPAFVHHFFSNIYDSMITKQSLDMCLIFISDKRSKFSEIFTMGINNTLASILSYFPEDKSIFLACDFLDMMVNALLKNDVAVKTFEGLIELIILHLPKITKSKNSHLYFIYVMKYLSLNPEYLPKHMKHYQIIEKSLNTLTDPQYSKEINDSLIKIVGGISFNDSHNLIPIRNAHMLLILLKYSMKEDDTFISVLSSLKNWLHHSFYNAEAIHENDIDIFLLDYAYSHSMDLVQSPIITKYIFHILSDTNKIVASQAVVQKYIDLILPINSMFVNIYVPFVINTLCTIFQYHNSIPMSSIPLNSQSPVIQVHNVPAAIFQTSFQLAFWVRVEPYPCQLASTLLKIKDTKFKGLEIQMSNEKIIILYHRKHQTITQEFEVKFSCDKFSFIGINFKNCGKHYELSIMIDNTETPYSNCPFKPFYDGELFFLIASNMPNLVSQGYLSGFGVFLLSAEDNYHSYSNGRLNTREPPHFFIQIISKQSDLHAVVIGRFNQIKCELSSSIPQLSSLVDFLVDETKISSMIYLFSMIDYTTIDGHKFENMCDLAIDLLTSFIISNPSSQQALINTNCIETIVALLLICNPKNITYSLYLHFSTMVSILNNNEFKSQFIKILLMNLDIWKRSNKNILRQVTNHWYTVLFRENQDLFIRKIPLSTFFFLIKGTTDITDNIISLLKCYLSVELAIDAFVLIIGFCCTSTDLAVVKQYLTILKDALFSANSLAQLEEKSKYMTYLYKLLGYHDEDIFVLILEVIINSHHKELIQAQSLLQHLNIILNQLDDKLKTLSALKRVIALANDNNTELLPICCIIAQYNRKEGVDLFAQLINSNLSFDSKDSLLWIVSLFCSANATSQHTLFKILYTKDPNKITEIINIMRLVCIASNTNPDDNIITFLSYSLSIISNSVKEEMQQILQIAFNALLFHTDTSFNKVFNDSIFNKNKSETSFNWTRPRTVFEQIMKLAHESIPLKFSIRLNESGNWIDMSMAMQCLNLFEQYFSINLLPHSLLICSIMTRIRPNTAIKHLKHIGIAQHSSKISSDLISYFILNAQKANVDVSFMTTPNSFSHYNAFSYLETFANTYNPSSQSITQTANEISTTYEQFLTIYQEYVSQIKDDTPAKALQNCIDENEIRSHQLKEFITMWNMKKRKNTKKNMIWQQSSLIFELPIIWRRDLSLISFGYQIKIKRSIFKLHRAPKIPDNVSYVSCPSTYIRRHEEFQGDFILFDDYFQFKSMIVKLTKINFVRINGNKIEFFLKNRKSRLFMFESTEIFNKFQQFIEEPKLDQMIDSWIEDNITNFELILYINGIKNKSFSDISNYPFFPAIKDQSIDPENSFSPEYYSMPEYFTLFKVAEANSNPYDLVYNNRKVLNSSNITNWVKEKFSIELPNKEAKARVNIEPKRAKIPTNVSRASFHLSGDFGFIINSNQKPFVCSIQHSKGSLNPIDINGIYKASCAHNGSAYFVAKQATNFLLFDMKTLSFKSSGNLEFQIIKIAACNHYIATACTNLFVYLWKEADLSSPFAIIRAYRNDIASLTFNMDFDLMIITSSDGVLQFSSIRNGIAQRLVDLDDLTPKFVKISPAWGFVLVVEVIGSSSMLLLYNVNGNMIRSKRFNEVITDIDIWQKGGIDYCAIITDIGNLFVFELFFFDIKDPLLCDKNFVSLSYAGDDKLIYTTKNGEIVTLFNPMC